MFDDLRESESGINAQRCEDWRGVLPGGDRHAEVAKTRARSSLGAL
jgi:hypothetical protein